MKNRDAIIHDMCLTYRHDYDLIKPEGDPTNLGYALLAGITPEEQLALYRQMEQIYDNNIAPVLIEYMDEIAALRKQYAELKYRMDSLEH